MHILRRPLRPRHVDQIVKPGEIRIVLHNCPRLLSLQSRQVMDRRQYSIRQAMPLFAIQNARAFTARLWLRHTPWARAIVLPTDLRSLEFQWRSMEHRAATLGWRLLRDHL